MFFVKCFKIFFVVLLINLFSKYLFRNIKFDGFFLRLYFEGFFIIYILKGLKGYKNLEKKDCESSRCWVYFGFCYLICYIFF